MLQESLLSILQAVITIIIIIMSIISNTYHFHYIITFMIIITIH